MILPRIEGVLDIFQTDNVHALCVVLSVIQFVPLAWQVGEKEKHYVNVGNLEETSHYEMTTTEGTAAASVYAQLQVFFTVL